MLLPLGPVKHGEQIFFSSFVLARPPFFDESRSRVCEFLFFNMCTYQFVYFVCFSVTALLDFHEWASSIFESLPQEGITPS